MRKTMRRAAFLPAALAGLWLAATWAARADILSPILPLYPEDIRRIIHPAFGDPRSLHALFDSSYASSFLEWHYSPLPNLILWARGALFGWDPAPFRCVQWAAGSAAVALVGLAGSAFLGAWAWLAAALYGVHTLKWGLLAMSGDGFHNVLVTDLALLAVLVRRKYPRTDRKSTAAIAVLLLMALATKEIGAFLPGLLLAQDLAAAGVPRRGPERRRWAALYLILLAFEAAYFLFVRFWIGKVAGVSIGFAPDYSLRAVLPGLWNHIADMLGALWAPFPAAVAAAAFVSAAWAAKRQPRLAAFCLVWSVIGAAIYSNLLPLGPAYYRYVMQSGMGINFVHHGLLAGVGVCWLAALCAKTAAERRAPFALGAALLWAAGAAWSAWVFRSEFGRYRDESSVLARLSSPAPSTLRPDEYSTLVYRSALLSLPNLERRDPARGRAYREALSSGLGDKAPMLLDYVEGAPASACRAAWLERCITENAASLDPFVGCIRAGTALESGLAAERGGRLADAGRGFEDALKDFQVPAGVLAQLASLRWNSGDREGGLMDARHSLRLPQAGDWLYVACGVPSGFSEELAASIRESAAEEDRAVGHFKKGELEEAASRMKEAVRLDPSRPKAWLRLGALQSGLGERAPARSSFRQARRLDGLESEFEARLADLAVAPAVPDERLSAYERGWLEGAMAGRRMGTRARERASARRDKDEGIRLYQTSRKLEARIRLESAVRRDPGDAEAWLSLGTVQEALGDRASALASYRRALEERRRLADWAAVIGAHPDEKDGVLAAAKESAQRLGGSR
jgi:Tfp pilus assembly protein PilF